MTFVMERAKYNYTFPAENEWLRIFSVQYCAHYTYVIFIFPVFVANCKANYFLKFKVKGV